MKEEITKEIKNLDEIEKKENEVEELEPTEEPTEETTEETEEVKEDNNSSEEKKPMNKKLIIIIGSCVIAIILIILLNVLLLPKDKKEEDEPTKKNNDSKFAAAVKASIESGDFDKAIKKGLDATGISTDKVCLISMDLDSDGDQGIVAYAEDSNLKAIIQLEVDDEVNYDDSFPLDSKDSIGYAYSSDKLENYWYTEYSKTYTIISSAKKIIKEDDFLNNYFSLTKTYKEKPVLNNCIEYKMDKELDVKSLEKEAITTEKLLKDNSIKEEEIGDAYKKYVTDKEEKEKKEKEEKEKQAKEEEERKKLQGTLKLGNYSYKFGTYKVYNEDNELDGTMILYSDLSCVYNETTCTYTVGEVRGNQDELVPGIALSTGHIFITSVDEGVLLETSKALVAKYEG